MTKYEKIILIVLAIVIMVIAAFSIHEIREYKDGGRSDFDESFGNDFRLGPFYSVISEDYSGDKETNCEKWQPVIVVALHDIKDHLKSQKIAGFGNDDYFEVNGYALQIFCNKNVILSLGDGKGNKLVLQKSAWQRTALGDSSDFGTEIRIDATFIPLGEGKPASPTTFGRAFVPDRFLENLDITTTSKP